MAIVIISSTSAALRKEVAENLAGKLGYPCLGREELVDQATEAGIPVGKLEMSVIKSPAQSEGSGPFEGKISGLYHRRDL